MEVGIIFDRFEETFEQNALVDCLNSTQSYFHFSILNFPLSLVGNTINAEAISNEIEKYNLSYSVICLTMRRLNDNWFSHDFKGLSVISGYGYEVLGIEFSLRSFYIYQIAQSLISIALGVDEYSLSDLCHEETRGCINDFCGNKTEIIHGMRKGVICSDCIERIINRGIDQNALKSVSLLLTLVAHNVEDNIALTDEKIKTHFGILHLSDLHFGKNSYAFNPRIIRDDILEPLSNVLDLGELIASDLDGMLDDPKLSQDVKSLIIGIDVVVITGDIANSAGANDSYKLKANGSSKEYDQAHEFLKSLFQKINVIKARYGRKALSLENELMIVPGNHDVNWEYPPEDTLRFYGYVEFLSNTLSNRDFYGKSPNEIFVSKVLTVLDKNLFIAGFNSCTVTSEPEKLRNIGLVDYRQMQLCNEALSKVGKKIHRKIALVHHHPSYIPLLSDDNNEYDALSQSGEFMTFLQENGFDLILHGHKHYPVEFVHSMRPYEVGDRIKLWTDPVIISGGSVSVKEKFRNNGIPNTYNIVGLRLDRDVFSKKVIVERRKFARHGFMQRFESDLVRHLGDDTLTNLDNTNKLSSVKTTESDTPQLTRTAYYAKADGWMVIHQTRRSEQEDKYTLVRISLLRHHNSPPPQKHIQKVIYDVGDMFGGPYVSTTQSNDFELLVEAYAPFLCVATIFFNDNSRVTEERYIDFHII